MAFSKWHDPWGFDEEEDDGYNKNAVDDELPPYDDDEYSGAQPKTVKALMTPMGPIPLNEHSSPSKNWNFWMGHSNFRITKKIAKIISKVDGVETLDIFSPYRLRVGIGKLFVPGQVIGRITSTVQTELNKT